MIERRQNARRLVCDPGTHRYKLVQALGDHCRMQCEHCGGDWLMGVERRAEERWDDGCERLFTEAEFVVLSGRMTWEV